jgi:hypothetical protein
MAIPHCFNRFPQLIRLAASLALLRPGIKTAIKMAIMAMTTNSSMSVNALFRKVVCPFDMGRTPDILHRMHFRRDVVPLHFIFRLQAG